MQSMSVQEKDRNNISRMFSGLYLKDPKIPTYGKPLTGSVPSGISIACKSKTIAGEVNAASVKAT